LFVAVLGASNYTYAEATYTQQTPDFIGSHMRALAFFGGVPRITVPDNLKSGVTKVCRHEPTLQRSYEDFANHYGTAIIPARPYKPHDKAKVDVAVQIAQRWILGRLRNRVFHSLSALNTAIRQSMADLHARVMRDYKASRREMYERFDRPALLALPADRFDVTEWKLVTVNVDHVVVDERHYSVPHELSHKSCGCVPPRRPCRFFEQASESRHIRVLVKARSRPSRSTCLARIVSRRTGRPRASSRGPRN
jgi:hypothetical protein